jgi:LysM repeat protein
MAVVLLSAAIAMLNTRRLILYLILNVIVSAATVLAVLWWWERTRAPLTLPSTSIAAATSAPEAAPLDTPGVAVTPLPTPAPPAPILHTVQSGETLGAIAERYGVTVEDILLANNLTDPNVLAVGQQLLIPIGGFNPTPTLTPEVMVPTPLPTATRDPNLAPPNLTIREVKTAGVLETEVVVLVNSGGPVDLVGWSLRDEGGRIYTFPALTLFEGGAVNVHTRAGPDTVIDLYWGQTEAVWSAGELVLLADPNGNLIARYTVP